MPHRSTITSYPPDGFCYSLGVYEDREQVVNIPFKLLVAFWKQSTWIKTLWNWGKANGISPEEWCPAPAVGVQKRQLAPSTAGLPAGVPNAHCAQHPIPAAKAAAWGTNRDSRHVQHYLEGVCRTCHEDDRGPWTCYVPPVAVGRT